MAFKFMKKGDAAGMIVQCGDCQWRGHSDMLTKADGLAYCPYCGREFMEFPPRSPPQEGAKP